MSDYGVGMTEEDLLGIPDRVKGKFKDCIAEVKASKVVEITPKVVEDELKELKKEVKRLEKVISEFKKMFNNWHKFKHQLGL